MGSKGKGRDSDGLTPLPPRKGRKWWEARIVYTDKKTGKKRDTKARFQADTRLLALQERDRRIKAARDGNSPQKKSERKRFGEAAESWFDTLLSKGTRTSWGSHMRQLKATFGDYWCDAVETHELQDYLDARAHLQAGTVNHHRQVAIKIFAHAMKKGWCSSNPALGTEKRSEAKERARLEALEDPPKVSLTLAELERFMDDLRKNDPEVWPLAATQFVLGQRFSEVSALRITDVDWETSEVRTRRGHYRGEFGPTKGRYARLGALGVELLAELKIHRARMEKERWPGWDTLLFPRPLSGHRRQSNAWSYFTVRHAYKRSFERIGVDVQTATHVMRRAMINATREDFSNALMRKVVGHKSEEMTAVYSAAERAEVINIAEYLSKAVVGRSGTSGGRSAARDNFDPRND